jgi:hypothetical protein
MDVHGLIGILASGLLSVVAYFVKELHTDFRKMEQNFAGLRADVRVLGEKLRSDYDILSLRVDRLEQLQPRPRRSKGVDL